jgi:hypothetical protein
MPAWRFGSEGEPAVCAEPRRVFSVCRWSVIRFAVWGRNPVCLKMVVDRISLSGVAAGAVLAGRYRVDHVVPSPGAARAFIGATLETGQRVMLLEVGASAATLLGRALLVSHPNLATLLELIPLPEGDFLAVVESPHGTTLKERLQEQPQLPLDTAVGYALCVANALGALHQRGAAHGLLRPASVVLATSAPGGAILAYAPPVPPPNPFRNPERGLGAPSPADDVWALSALLFHMLVGRPPPTFGVRRADDLKSAGISQARLRELIANCLRPQPAHRVTIVGAVVKVLAESAQRVERGEKAVQPTLVPRVPAGPSAPEAAPPSRRGAGAVSLGQRMLAAARSHPAVTLLAGVGGGFLAAAVAAAFVIARSPDLLQSIRREPLTVAASSAEQSSQLTLPASAEAAAAASVRASTPPGPQRGTKQPVSADRLPSGAVLTSCVIRQLPEDSFAHRPDFGWLCRTRDPREGVRNMRAALVAASGGRTVTPAMDLWSRMRWYAMAGFAVIRASCCESAEPLELPELSGCEPLDEILNEVATTVAAGRDHEAVLRRYTKSIRCNYRVGRAHLLWQRKGIGGGQQAAFLKLLRVRRGGLTP